MLASIYIYNIRSWVLGKASSVSKVVTENSPLYAQAPLRVRRTVDNRR